MVLPKGFTMIRVGNLKISCFTNSNSCVGLSGPGQHPNIHRAMDRLNDSTAPYYQCCEPYQKSRSPTGRHPWIKLYMLTTVHGMRPQASLHSFFCMEGHPDSLLTSLSICPAEGNVCPQAMPTMSRNRGIKDVDGASAYPSLQA